MGVEPLILSVLNTLFLDAWPAWKELSPCLEFNLGKMCCHFCYLFTKMEQQRVSWRKVLNSMRQKITLIFKGHIYFFFASHLNFSNNSQSFIKQSNRKQFHFHFNPSTKHKILKMTINFDRVALKGKYSKKHLPFKQIEPQHVQTKQYYKYQFSQRATFLMIG